MRQASMGRSYFPQFSDEIRRYYFPLWKMQHRAETHWPAQIRWIRQHYQLKPGFFLIFGFILSFVPFFYFIFPFLSLCILTNDTPGTVDTFCLSTPRGHSISDNRSGRIIWPARWRSLMSSMRRVLKAYLYPIFFAQSAFNSSIH